MITTNDFAVVIGISRYPQLSNLKNPVRNALAFAEWLTDPSGGALPPKNLKLVISNENSPDGDSAGPIQDDVDVAFRSLLGLPRTVQIGRRLYIYMAGHGYRSNSDQVALLLADASPTLMHSIATRAYADYIRQAGVFSEIVLFVDCDPAALSTGHLSPPPPFPRSIDSQSARPASVFYAFASTRGGASISSASISSAAVSSTNKQIIEDGLFSRALLEGLRGAAAASDGSVTSDALREYAAQRVRELGGREQQPEFLYEEGSPIVFVNPVQRKLLERVGAHADDPAIVDELGRRPFAEVIAARIEDVRKTQAAFRAMGDKSAGGAFMVHIHGPWGAGKTSVLNFLRDHLQDKKRCPAQQWVVVEFNAWRQQRIRPPWWTLIKEIYMQSARQLGFFRSLQLRVRWLAWRIRADWLPALLATLLISVAVLLSTGGVDFLPQKTGSDASGSVADKQAKAIELALKVLVAVLAAGAAVVTLSRSLVLGSARAAQTYIELRTDPLGPIVRFFQKLVRTVRRPLVVFVDDLDRCESKYVVELLEGIQTLFRSAPMTYVVAADRKWICSSFEKGYEEFGKTIGEPGRPLGYLFLEKIFQISVVAPHLSPEVRRAYWEGLLRSATTTGPVDLEEKRKRAEREALEKVKNAYTQEELDVKISEVADDPVREQAMRAAAAKQITSTEAQLATEHRLQRFADLLEPNPRSMKRLVNAYGLHQATHFLEGRSVSPEALALWTIVELRWPLLSDLLAAHPQWANDLAKGKVPDNNKIPKTLKELFGDDEVRGVFAGDAGGSSLSLDEEAVRRIVGRVGDVGASQASEAKRGK